MNRFSNEDNVTASATTATFDITVSDSPSIDWWGLGAFLQENLFEKIKEWKEYVNNLLVHEFRKDKFRVPTIVLNTQFFGTKPMFRHIPLTRNMRGNQIKRV